MENVIDELKTSLSTKNNSVADLQKLFFDISEKLMNEYEIQINDIKFELTEIEFYYFDERKHSDVYTHTHEKQLNSNRLYVHESWGNRGGIDLTFGNGEFYGGILIRGIKLHDQFVAGPAKVRDALIKELNQDFDSWEDLQKFFDDNPIMIDRKESDKEHKIYHSKRVGISEKENGKKYKNALYRFVREDYLLESNGDTRKNLKESTTIKAISSLTLGYDTNEKEAKKNVEKDEDLMKFIRLFNPNL